jgi:DNA-binding transcriptional regulator of glucitol operon
MVPSYPKGRTARSRPSRDRAPNRSRSGVAHNSRTYRCLVLRRYLFALRPGWILFHLFTVASVITMILLGRWQLHVSESKHFSIQNFGYSIQWWLFSAFFLFFWSRIVRDAARRAQLAAHPTSAEPVPAADGPVAYRRYVMPTAPERSSDPVHAAYNDYLASLAAKDEERS